MPSDNIQAAGGGELVRDASDTYGLHNGTNPQIINVYGTFTDLDNYEGLQVTHDGTDAILDSIAAGTGTVGNLELRRDGVAKIICRGASIRFENILERETLAGITASTTQTQGQGALLDDINEISVCANANDTVTLPVAGAGRTITIINNGAQTLRIFPASGDDLGAGVDTATTLAAGANVTYAAYDATNWEAV